MAPTYRGAADRLRTLAEGLHYAAFHERRELERNHLDHYDEHELIDLREAA